MSTGRDLAARVRDAALLEGDFVLSSGERSSFYVDKYLFSTEPDLLGDIAAGLSKMLPSEVDRLAGVELGAVPLVVALALSTGLPYVIVRKSVKGYGTGRGIEGSFEAGERIALIEDVVTTGAQSVAAARRLQEAGLEVGKILAVLDRRDHPGEALEEFFFGSLLKMGDLRVGSNN
ncbi:MAG: orotate phosphoribosyltransferase [Actinomycetota bacterium]|nr:orotate phosphoribosyltransferase [Actinomycetota bacterium]